MRMSGSAWLRTVGGALILAGLVGLVGLEPFVRGVRQLGAGTLVLATALTAVSTAAAAWRWRAVARALDVPLAQGSLEACYRSQLLNAVLPGGVLGDVHRALRHGHAVGRRGRGARSVAWERGCGQAVQVAVAVPVLVALTPPLRPVAAVLAGTLGSVAAATALASYVAGEGRVGRAARLAAEEARTIVRRAGVVVLVSSLVAVAGYVALFAVALHAVAGGAAAAQGVAVHPGQQVALALACLVAAALPLNVAGWGPREGAAAAAFAVAGLGAETGVAVSVAYGVLGLAGSLPALVLLRARRGRLAPAVELPEAAAHA